MGLCVFKTAYVKRCIQHALAAKKFRMPFSKAPPGPALLFVHDQGVYLMSNGLPADLILTAKSPTSYVVYADGCNPNIDPDWWETSRALVGGDDFGEILPIMPDWLTNCDAFDEFHVDVSPETIDTYFTAPRPAKKKVKA